MDRYIDEASLVDKNGGRMVDTMVTYARTVNKLFTRNTCRVCHIYSDKQVAFEQAIAEQAISPVERAAMKVTQLHPEVERYRRYLFDEDSVVKTVGSRDLESRDHNQSYDEE